MFTLRVDGAGFTMVAPVGPTDRPSPFGFAVDRVAESVLERFSAAAPDQSTIEEIWGEVERAHEPDEHGWRVLEHEDGLTYWLIPNELGGLTLTDSLPSRRRTAQAA